MSLRSLRRAALALAFVGVLFAPAAAQQKISFEQSDDGVAVHVDGELFTRYVVKSGTKPILWPVVGPTGKEMTRSYPMTDAKPGEKTDHIHHRSFWFTHGDVNGVSFWHEQSGGGEIVHREFVKVDAGPPAVLITRNDWIGPGGVKHCSDVRTFTFAADGDARWVDCVVTVAAPADKPVVFGDTKEGSFGVRVAGTMKVDAGLGGKIITSEGLTDGASWGKPAAWVDYHGPVEGEHLGVAILNHPTSYGYPAHWHVRTYGLFTANPWGLHDFKSPQAPGTQEVKAGESFTLKYRVVFHKGDEQQGRIAERFADYAKSAQ